MNLHRNYVVMQQCWEHGPSPLPRAVWLLQPGFFESICSYTALQYITQIEVFQPIFPWLHYLEMYMKEILQQYWEQYVLFFHLLAQYDYSNEVFWKYIRQRRIEHEMGLLTIFVK